MSGKKVYVIGAGLSGMSAAFAALDQGAEVVLVEKDANLGGNSAKATSGVNAVNTKYQLEHDPKIEDSVELFLTDILKSGKGICDKDLARSLAALSGEAVDELVARFGLQLSDLNQLGGHSASRTHRFPPKDGRIAPVGYTIAATLRSRLEAEPERVTILKKTKLVDFELSEVAPGHFKVAALTLEDGEGQRQVVNDASGVVFAAGGYGADSSPDSLLVKVRPDLEGFPTTNGPFATGDTVKIGIAKGLKTTDLDQVQLHPTGFVHPDSPEAPQKFLCPEVIRGIGAVLLAPNGSRFIDEVSTRDTVSAAIRTHCGDTREWQMAKLASPNQKMALMILSQEVAEKFGLAAFNFYKSKGFIFDLKDDSDVKRVAPGLTYQTILDELAAYDNAARGHVKDPHGKSRFPVIFGEDPVLYGAYITPSLHFTMGGLAIKTDARAVHNETGNGILNLFVAGENSGGVHGANRLGGNGCLESLVFGRLAGKRAGQVPPNLTEIPYSDSNESIVLAVSYDPAEPFVDITLAAPSPAHMWPQENKSFQGLTFEASNGQVVEMPIVQQASAIGECQVVASTEKVDRTVLDQFVQPGLKVVLT